MCDSFLSGGRRGSQLAGGLRRGLEGVPTVDLV
jgi:hypothetical protein